MGRQYKGLDYRKVTVRLDERQFDIVRHYGWKQQERVYAEQDRTGKQKPYSWKMSDVIHDAINLLGQYLELSDNMETSAANLLDIAEVFDKIDGGNAPVYARAIREAAALLLVFCYNAEWGYDGEKLIFRAKSLTKSKRGEKMVHETEVTVRSADGSPLIQKEGGPTPTPTGTALSQDRDKGPSEAQQSPSGGGDISLHPEALQTAQNAAQKAGETVSQFVERAVEAQAQRDETARKLAGG